MDESRNTRKGGAEGGGTARPTNPGLPDPKTVVSERTVISPKGGRYRIIRTNEKDAYDPPDDENRGGA